MNFNLTHAFKRGLRSSETNTFVWVFFFSFRAATDFKPFDIKAIG